jgi:hypothetical protein
MARIYKYPVPEVGTPFDVNVNGFCEVVHVGIDGNGTPCIWMLVMPEKPEEAWTYIVVATGEEFDTTKWCFIRTFQQGPLVWHLLRPVNQWKQ